MIFGLYLDGARWDPEGGHLSDSLPGQRLSKLPEIHFKPVQVISVLSNLRHSGVFHDSSVGDCLSFFFIKKNICCSP